MNSIEFLKLQIQDAHEIFENTISAIKGVFGKKGYPF